MDCSLPGSSVQRIFPGKNTGVGCQALLQGIFLTQGLNLSLLQTYISCTAGRFFTVLATREAPLDPCLSPIFLARSHTVSGRAQAQVAWQQCQGMSRTLSQQWAACGLLPYSQPSSWGTSAAAPAWARRPSAAAPSGNAAAPASRSPGDRPWRLFPSESSSHESSSIQTFRFLKQTKAAVQRQETIAGNKSKQVKERRPWSVTCAPGDREIRKLLKQLASWGGLSTIFTFLEGTGAFSAVIFQRSQKVPQ